MRLRVELSAPVLPEDPGSPSSGLSAPHRQSGVPAPVQLEVAGRASNLLGRTEAVCCDVLANRLSDKRIGKSVAHFFKQGAQNPIMCVNC